MVKDLLPAFVMQAKNTATSHVKMIVTSHVQQIMDAQDTNV
jgi:hypothetical protein